MAEQKQGVLYAVYGTLRQGFGNYKRLLDNEFCEYLGTQKTSPDFKMVSLGGFPGVIPGGKQEIVIEVFRVNSPKVEQQLDWLEGYPNFYGKTTLPTQWGEANMYILTEERYGQAPVVESGDWKQHVGRRG
jgi:gamma-glutamylcyclotransferase (GGCT)/AIG2-like uncharacterized protein YtfP